MNSACDVHVVRTGTANLASVCAGLRRIGARPRLSEDPNEIRAADRVVLPGVGAFGAALARLAESGLVAVLRERIKAGRSTLAICLGMQLLCEGSDETPGAAGLSVVSARVTRFANGARVPQLGWNRVEADQRCRLLQSGHAYFANSYKLTTAPADWNAAYAEHGGRYVAALECGPLLACQFHPELSGAWGLELLRRWLNAGERTGGPGC